MDEPTVLTPKQATERLGVSDATLRRYARTYERVFDKVEPGEHGRLYPAQVLERLSSAKAMQERGQAVSLEQALLMLREGVEAPTPAPIEAEALDLPKDSREALAAILRDEIREAVRAELAGEVEELRKLNGYLLEELRRRTKALEKPKRRPWWKWWG